MPLYEYTCEDCGKQTEQLVKNDAKPNCPECGSEHLTKLLSIFASPNRGSAAPAGGPARPGGSCGSGCGCHPH